MMKNFRLFTQLALVACGLALSSCQQDQEETAPTTENPSVRVQPLLTGYEIIWGMDFLPNGDLLFTEKRGRLYHYANGNTTQLTGLPTDISTTNQGGLLDLKVHPQYAANGWVYATYAGTAPNTQATRLNLIRFKIGNAQITDVETIFQTDASNTWYGHYGSRIVFDTNNMLYLSVGEGGPQSLGGASSPNQNAQNVKSSWGKVHRMTDTGQIPADNPVLPGNNAPTTVYSYGHRNPQGLILHPVTNELWSTEHGPRGGDELNIVQKGVNYGWPLVSSGINYDGTKISDSPTRDGIQSPVHTWTPSIGTSGLTVITSDKFGNWRGRLVTGALALDYLSVFELSNNRVVSETKLLEGERVRNVKQGPDGNLYISVESPGRILQVIPE